MTLDYASPEQVRGEPITTATDIYSLGVLLYKLLTGKSPYGLTARSDSALHKAICEQEPLKPSAVVLTDEKGRHPGSDPKDGSGDQRDPGQGAPAAEEETSRRPGHDRPDGAAQGAPAPIRFGRAVFRGYPPVLGRTAGHRPERYVRLPGRKICQPQCRGWLVLLR